MEQGGPVPVDGQAVGNPAGPTGSRPLIMTLHQDPVRLPIADDATPSGTIESIQQIGR